MPLEAVEIEGKVHFTYGTPLHEFEGTREALASF